MAKPGDVFVDFEDQLLKFDDGAVIQSTLRAGAFVSARQKPWLCVPDTGLDMTAEIQAALDGCPLGTTLVFDPGTYVASGSFSETRGINIWAPGMVIDYGSTVLSSPAFQWGSTNATHRRLFCVGLSLTRTAATAATTDRLYEGFRWKAMYNCEVRDVTATNFAVGHRLMGDHANIDGNSYNIYSNLSAFNCTKGVQIKPDSTGDWTNENVFLAGRMDQVFSDPQNSRACSIEASGGSIPNNNRFYGTSLETSWGRKIYCEGEFNAWHDCRFETESTAADGFEIEFNQGVSGTGRRNLVMNGFGLAGMEWTEVGASAIENQVVNYSRQDLNNTFILARAMKLGFGTNPGNSLFRGDDSTTLVGFTGPLNALNQSSPVGHTISVLDVTGLVKRLVLMSRMSSVVASRGGIVWLDDAAALLNELGVSTSSPFRILASGGIQATTDLSAALFRVLNGAILNGTIAPADGTSGTDVDDVEYTQSRRSQGGRHLFSGGTTPVGGDVPTVAIKNIGGGGGPALALCSALTVNSTLWRHTTAAWLNALGVFEFLDSTGAILYNALFQISTVMGAGRPLCFRNGFWANQEGGDFDSRVSGLADDNLTYWDASLDRVGVGTPTPDSKFHVAGKVHSDGDAEIDGALDHDGTTAGFFGTAPATRPTVTGSRGGNAALASLLTGLASLGLIIDSSTA